MNAKAYYFNDDGIIPNHALPVIVYSQCVHLEDCSDCLETTFKKNNWLNNWRDIVLPYDHFHSNTHEVLGLGWGNVSLKIGGDHGQVFHLHTGDVIIIPAGVGHYSVSEHSNYQMIGGYPNGHAWDLKTGLEPGERAQILQAISEVELPEKVPIFGNGGLLLDQWK